MFAEKDLRLSEQEVRAATKLQAILKLGATVATDG